MMCCWLPIPPLHHPVGVRRVQLKKISYTKSIEVDIIEAGRVPEGFVLIHQTVKEFTESEYDGWNGYLQYSYSFPVSTEIFEAGDLAPIAYFSEGTLLVNGETATFEDYGSGLFTVTNCDGRVID